MMGFYVWVWSTSELKIHILFVDLLGSNKTKLEFFIKNELIIWILPSKCKSRVYSGVCEQMGLGLPLFPGGSSRVWPWGSVSALFQPSSSLWEKEGAEGRGWAGGSHQGHGGSHPSTQHWRSGTSQKWWDMRILWMVKIKLHSNCVCFIQSLKCSMGQWSLPINLSRQGCNSWKGQQSHLLLAF